MGLALHRALANASSVQVGDTTGYLDAPGGCPVQMVIRGKGRQGCRLFVSGLQCAGMSLDALCAFWDEVWQGGNAKQVRSSLGQKCHARSHEDGRPFIINLGSEMITRPDYLLVGHITRDLLNDGSTVPGGTSFYAAITAHRLGKVVAVISASAELPYYWPEAINMAFVSPASPTFANKYTAHARQQTVFTRADPITLADVPLEWRTAPIVHLSPVLGETPEAFVHAFPRALLGVTPQGWMRSLGSKLPSVVTYRRWDPSPQCLSRIDALILSIEDIEGDESLASCELSGGCPFGPDRER
jgi:hypothetical protein